ncbi:MAG: hypothetical protein AB1610_04770 [Nitrospirota bacterium]
MKSQIKYLQNLFYELLNDYGRVFVIVKYSEHTIIGKRGFTDEEKEKGIVLVVNNKNHKNLQWTEDGGIAITLSFGANNRTENCFLHCDDIVALYSPDAKVKFERWDILNMENLTRKPEVSQKESFNKKIIPLDNYRK